jgi:hypothetical protein
MLISRLRKSCQYAGIFLLTFALVTVAAEGMFRCLGDRPSADLKGLYTSFGKSGYKLAANVDTSAAWAAGPWTVSSDALGLRCDKERTIAAHEGSRLDVLFLGDSQGFGHGVDFAESLAGSAAIAGRQAGRKVANASVGGHGVANQLEIAKWLANEKGVRAKHLVYLCTPNVVLYPDSYVTSVVGEDGKLYSRELSGLNAWRASLEATAKQTSVVYARVRDAVRNLNIGTRPAADAGPMVGLYAAASPPVAYAPAVAFAERLREMAAVLGGKAHVVYVPLSVEFEFDGIAAEAGKSGMAVNAGAPFEKLSGAAKDSGIGFFTLKPALERGIAAGLPLRLRGDFHYSREISPVCGRDLWGYLEKALETNP